MRTNFNERKAKRIEHAKEMATKKQKQSEALYNSAKKMASAIPLGQPILIGHHSENADRRYRDKIHNTYGKSFEASDKAKYYEEKAITIENNTSISSDDPEALIKLKEKLNNLQKLQVFMKDANKCIRNKDKESFLKLEFGTEENWDALNKPDYMNRIGFASYSMTNNSANIRRIKERIQKLEKIESLTTTEITIGDIKIVANVEANRVQIFFPSKPDFNYRNQLKKNGFRWTPSEGTWQRHLSHQAFRIAKEIITPK